MARASRSSKKQPAFDPSELQDLIFSPAVGSGVGSHLVGATEEFPAPKEARQNKTDNMSTVATSVKATIGVIDETTVDISHGQRTIGLRSAALILQHLPLVTPARADANVDMPTVVVARPPTVDRSTTVGDERQGPRSIERPTEAITNATTVGTGLSPTVVHFDVSTVAVPESTGQFIGGCKQPPDESPLRDEMSELGQGREEVPEITRGMTPASDHSTVAKSDLSTVHSEIHPKRPPAGAVLWITEHGDLVPKGRVKRIRLAQDVINSAEESVYDTLWAAKSQPDEREASKIVQAGYDYLVKRTRLSKKTIQRIVAKLIDKDFIAIEHPADIYQRTSTVYRVFSYKAVLDRHLQRGRSHVAKMGPGFSYVRPIEDPRQSAVNSAQLDLSGSAKPVDLSTMAKSHQPTVVRTVPTTPANRTTETVAGSDASTVVRATTTFIGKDALENNTSSSSAIHQVLSTYGAVDDDIVDRLIRNCKQQTPDCTDEEIIHFIKQKGLLVRVRDSRIYSPIGFLLTAVPKCLSGEAFRLYREEEVKRREAEAAYEARRQAELDEWRREQEARLVDPSVSEQDKQFIRECLGIR
jgi:hypothetical protein